MTLIIRIIFILPEYGISEPNLLDEISPRRADLVYTQLHKYRPANSDIRWVRIFPGRKKRAAFTVSSQPNSWLHYSVIVQ
ncbi:MAG TPA: hypothetical protein DCM64_12950 [Gammaproteobacteria bacterium]|jgi:hypothetical protein|nr:hypothetical protein [Gammaproteobacteria bacterium]